MKLLLSIFILFYASFAAATACPSGYSFSTTINFIPSVVFGGSNLTNIPMRFSGGAAFAGTGSGGNLQSATGLDLVFCDSSATNLVNYELVVGTYNSTTGYGQWYVQVASLSVSAVTTLTIEYGKSGATDQSNAAGTWSNGYLIVHHFGTSGTLTLTDSTGNCTATNHSATAAAGYIDGGAAFNGSSAYIDTGCIASATAYTFEMWGDVTGSTGGMYLGNTSSSSETDGIFFQQSPSGGFRWQIGTSTGPDLCTAGGLYGIPSLVTSRWQHVAGTYDGVDATQSSSYRIYVDGQDIYCVVTTTHGSTMGTPLGHMQYGNWPGGSNFFGGTLDEVRISSVKRTQGWIQTSWFNETFNSSSYYLGSANTLPSTGLDQLPAPVNFADGTTGAFQVNVTAGNTIIITGRKAGTVGTVPTDTLGTTYTLVGSNTAGVAVNPFVWIGVPISSGADTITFPSGVVAFVKEWPAAIGSTVDVSNSGSLPQTGQIIPPALTTTVNGDFMYCYVTGNGGALSFLEPAVSDFMPQWNGLVALSGTNAVVADSYTFTGVNGSYSCPFDNYGVYGDGTQNTAEEYVTFALKPSAITIVTASLPSAATSNAYFYTLQAVGGVGAYTWSVSSGALPGGLTLNANGTITGTATSGTTTPTFQVTDGTHTTTAALTLTVNSAVSTCSIVSSSSSSSPNHTVSLGTVTSGNIILASTQVVNDFFAELPTDTLGTHFKWLGVLNTRGPYILYQQNLFEGIATSTGSDSVTTNCSTGATCYAAAVQITNCQPVFDNINGIIASSINILGTATIYGAPLYTPTPNSEAWGIASSGANNGGNDMNFTAGSGFTGDASSGSSGVGDMLGEHQNTSGGIPFSFGQSLSPVETSPLQMLWDLVLRPTTSGLVSSAHPHAWVNQN